MTGVLRRCLLTALVIGGADLACRSPRHETAATEKGPEVKTNTPAPAPAPTEAGPQSRMLTLLQGRVVDLGGMGAIHTLTATTPDEERSDPAADLGAVLMRDGKIETYRLSTGERLWSRLPYAPCRTFFMAGAHVYANCGERLLSYGRLDGREKILAEGQGVQQAMAWGDLVFSDHGTGRVTVFDARDDHRIVSKVLRPIARMYLNDASLIPRPDEPGICYLGVVARGIFSPNQVGYTAACFDAALKPIWNKRLSFGRAPRFGYDLIQEGPNHLVIRDGGFYADQKPEQQRTGIIVSWRDGQVTPFEDGTFATIEDGKGERIVDPAVLKVFADTKSLPMGSEWRTDAGAVARTDGQRAFVLIRNQVSGLAGIDLVAKRVLFLVPVTTGQGLSLVVEGGFPIVRAKTDNGDRGSVHDPATGRVLYTDTRI